MKQTLTALALLALAAPAFAGTMAPTNTPASTLVDAHGNAVMTQDHQAVATTSTAPAAMPAPAPAPKKAPMKKAAHPAKTHKKVAPKKTTSATTNANTTTAK